MDYPDGIVRELIQGGDRSKWIAHSNHSVQCFTEDEIIRFTNNYETMLGRGAFGQVYQGVLEDKSIVAVKRFINNVKENFAKELTVHREINHKNVVRLLGYCLDENALMMVTEYIPKGNLCDLLHGSSIPVPLDTRVRIAIECAEALGYMHSQMYTQVIHGDIKPSNILLDDGLRAKISDFGISRLVNTENTLYTQNVMGSIGYMDPLFALNGRLTAKSDVYSFGVVLLELVTRRKARNYDGEIGLVENFTKVLAKGARRVREMFDAEIAIPSNMKTIEQIAKLAAKCLRLEHDKRPEMLEVADRLRRLRKALDRGQETETRTPFSWGKITKLVNLGIVAPDETTASLESSSSSTRNVGTFIAGSAVACPLFVLDDLFRASTEVLGHSTVRTTYKATLDSGAELVMRILVGVDLPKEEFEQRAMAIGAVQNEHIAPLQFYYYSNVEKLLVYNHFSRGSLATVLHGDLVCTRATLRWEQRLSISVAAARGVAFIHSLGASSCHGNIRSSNILLTGTDGTCVVSEHGLRTLGLFPNASGYQAPEVADDDMWVTQKADVYSFGILLLELLTRKAPVKKTQFKEGVDLVRLILNRTMVYEVLDMELLDHENKGERKIRMMRLMHLAIFCCDSDPNLRPTMSYVAEQIEEIRCLLTPT